jgi:hypothetical protein
MGHTRYGMKGKINFMGSPQLGRGEHSPPEENCLPPVKSHRPTSD